MAIWRLITEILLACSRLLTLCIAYAAYYGRDIGRNTSIVESALLCTFAYGCTFYLPILFSTDFNSIALCTKFQDFLHARCKKSLLDVKNLPAAFVVGISIFLDWKKIEVPESCLSLYVIAPPPLHNSVRDLKDKGIPGCC